MDARTPPNAKLNVHCLSCLPIRKPCTFIICPRGLTLILLTWRIWWPTNNASKWQMGFNSAFKGLTNPLNPQFSWLYVIKHHHSTGMGRHLHHILATLDLIFVLCRQLKMLFSWCSLLFTCRLSAVILLSLSFVLGFNMFMPSCVRLFAWCWESPRRLVTSTGFTDFSHLRTWAVGSVYGWWLVWDRGREARLPEFRDVC